MRPPEAVTVKPGAVRETLREILFEIPRFRVLVERGLPENVVSGPTAEVRPKGQQNQRH